MFFITTTGNKIKKIFDRLNAQCKKRNIRLPNNPDGTPGELLKISSTLIRKQIETAGKDHRSCLTASVAAALQHTEATAKRHYYVSSAAEARQQYQAVKVVEASAIMEEDVKNQ